MRKKGNLEKAIYFLEKSLALDPSSLYLKKELANLFLRQRKTEKALAIVQEMLAEKPEDIPLMILYGKLLQGLKRESEALTTYEKILKMDPAQKEIYLRLGAIYTWKKVTTKMRSGFITASCGNSRMPMSAIFSSEKFIMTGGI